MHCSGSPGPRMSASQLTYALSTWPELSEQERMARFMAALHVTRPGATADASSHRTADMLSAVLSGSPADGQPLQDAPGQHALYHCGSGSSLRSSSDTSSAGGQAGEGAPLAASWSFRSLLCGLHPRATGSMASGEPGGTAAPDSVCTESAAHPLMLPRSTSGKGPRHVLIANDASSNLHCRSLHA